MPPNNTAPFGVFGVLGDINVAGDLDMLGSRGCLVFCPPELELLTRDGTLGAWSMIRCVTLPTRRPATMTPDPRNPEFDDGSDARKDFRRGSGRANPRKTLQLCSQVRRALEVGLTDEALDPVLMDVRVDRVEPTSNDSRLAVWFAVEGEAAQQPRSDLAALLEAARPILLREVAATINRRKLPELAFELMLSQ